jgi:hypothetical protein
MNDVLGCSVNCSTAVRHVMAEAATNAGIGRPDDVSTSFNANYEVGVDVDGAEVVHHDSDAKPVIAVEDTIEQGSPAGAEPGERGYRSDMRVGFTSGSIMFTQVRPDAPPAPVLWLERAIDFRALSISYSLEPGAPLRLQF